MIDLCHLGFLTSVDGGIMQLRCGLFCFVFIVPLGFVSTVYFRPGLGMLTAIEISS